MEVHGRQHDNTREQLQRIGRDSIRSARPLQEGAEQGKAEAPAPQASQEARDEIELSAAAAAKAREVDEDRAEKAQALAEAIREGRLLTPERLERAAAKMLGG